MTESAQQTNLRDVHVRLFAAAKERAGTETVTVRLPTGASVHDLRRTLGESIPELLPLVPHLLFAIGTTYARDDDPLPASGEIVAFPPVSGG